jgi:putative transcriptional regulator
MMVSKENIVAIPADPSDGEDFPVSVAGLERAQMGRRIRKLRNRLGLSQEAFSAAYGIPLANIRQYEIGRNMPPPAVRAYLRVIDAEPELVARAIAERAA